LFSGSRERLEAAIDHHQLRLDVGRLAAGRELLVLVLDHVPPLDGGMPFYAYKLHENDR